MTSRKLERAASWVCPRLFLHEDLEPDFLENLTGLRTTVWVTLFIFTAYLRKYRLPRGGRLCVFLLCLLLFVIYVRCFCSVLLLRMCGSCCPPRDLSAFVFLRFPVVPLAPNASSIQIKYWFTELRKVLLFGGSSRIKWLRKIKMSPAPRAGYVALLSLTMKVIFVLKGECLPRLAASLTCAAIAVKWIGEILLRLIRWSTMTRIFCGSRPSTQTCKEVLV